MRFQIVAHAGWTLNSCAKITLDVVKTTTILRLQLVDLANRLPSPSTGSIAPLMSGVNIGGGEKTGIGGGTPPNWPESPPPDTLPPRFFSAPHDAPFRGIFEPPPAIQ